MREIITTASIMIPIVGILLNRFYDHKSYRWIFMVYFGAFFIAFGLGQVLYYVYSIKIGLAVFVTTLIVWGWVAWKGFKARGLSSIVIGLIPACFFMLILFYAASHKRPY